VRTTCGRGSRCDIAKAIVADTAMGIATTMTETKRLVRENDFQRWPESLLAGATN
jgi:hypothetical protein